MVLRAKTPTHCLTIHPPQAGSELPFAGDSMVIACFGCIDDYANFARYSTLIFLLYAARFIKKSAVFYMVIVLLRFF